MTVSAEEMLTRYLEEAVVRHGFTRISVEPADETLRLLAAWKCKTLNMNRGIALVSLGSISAPPGQVVHTIKKPMGKRLGYFPFLYELGLQLVLIGRGVLDKSTDLGLLVDSASRFTVTLQSIHLVDTEAGELIRHLPDDADVEAESPLPDWAKAIEFIRKVRNPLASKLLRGHSRLRYSVETRSAALSVRTWGQTRTGPVIDAIEDGIDRFIHGEE